MKLIEKGRRELVSPNYDVGIWCILKVLLKVTISI